MHYAYGRLNTRLLAMATTLLLSSALISPACNCQTPVKKCVIEQDNIYFPRDNLSITQQLGGTLQNLIDRELENDQEYLAILKEEKVKHHFKRLLEKTLTATEEVISLNASGSSKATARSLLDRNDLDLEAETDFQFHKQIFIQKYHYKCLLCLLQFAESNDCTTHIDGLSEETISKAKAIVQNWSDNIGQNCFADDVGYVTVSDYGKMEETFKSQAIKSDPLIKDLKMQLFKIAYPNKLKDHTRNMILTAFDTSAYMMPTAPIAAAVEAIKGLVVVSTGGCEEDKLIHIIQMCQRLKSRENALAQEISLALHARQSGLQSKNYLLVLIAEALINNLTSET